MPNCERLIGQRLQDQKKHLRKIVISQELCKGCGICIAMCPVKVLTRSDRLSSRGVYPPLPVKGDECIGCRICQHYCPDFAIYIVEEGEN